MQAVRSYATILFVIALTGVLSLTPVFSLLTSNLPIASSGEIIYISPLHVEGRYIKDYLGNIVYLRGVGKIHWDDDPTGWWSAEGVAWYQGYLNWNEDAVRYHLRTMKEWGLNHVRFHIVADWWIQDTVTLNTYTGSYRNNLKQTFEIATEEGMYVIMDLYSPVNGSWMYANGYSAPSLPFPPYSYPECEAVIGSKQEFVDWWAMVADELKVYPNVIFELYNEPHAGGFPDVATARDDWFDAVQKAIYAIRNTGAENLILVGWPMATVPHMGWEAANAGNLGWIEAYPLNDPLGNIFYTAHLYRCFYNPIWYDSYDYDDCYTKMEQCLFKYVVENLSKPVIIGEIGVNMWYSGVELERELQWAKNVFSIANDWGIGYSAWDWTLVDRWHVAETLGWTPSAWGQVLIDAVAEGGTKESV